jgi:hypothetical protein
MYENITLTELFAKRRDIITKCECTFQQGEYQCKFNQGWSWECCEC